MDTEVSTESFARRVTRWLYPAQCALCGALTETDGQLCPTCWRDTPFLSGLSCHLCGNSLPGDDQDGTVTCDDCMALPRPWKAGRAALAYRDRGRRIVLSLKHGDRLDLVGPAAVWMRRAGADVLTGDTILVPIPISWSRMVWRKYNQAAELARAIGRQSGCRVIPDALSRPQATGTQDGKSVEARFANVEGAILVSAKRRADLVGQNITVIDDVMTSGATLSVAARALTEAGAKSVNILVLARAQKAP